jgi:hypothetical protein
MVPKYSSPTKVCMVRAFSIQVPLEASHRILGPGARPFLGLGTWDMGPFSSWDLGPDPFLSLGPGTGDFTIVKSHLVIFYNSKPITISRVHTQGRTASTSIPGGHTRHIPMTHDRENGANSAVLEYWYHASNARSNVLVTVELENVHKSRISDGSSFSKFDLQTCYNFK